MEPWRPEGRGRSQWRREGLKLSLEGSVDQWTMVADSHNFEKEQDPDPGHIKINADPAMWIRIHIHLAVLDQDSYYKCGSGCRSMENDQN